MGARNSPDFIAHMLELLGARGTIEARRMFGGHGLYRDGMVFALVLDDTLYLKTDELTRPAFEAQGLAPFTYRNGTRDVVTSYWTAPPEALDSPAVMREWKERALAAARRSATEKASKKVTRTVSATKR